MGEEWPNEGTKKQLIIAHQSKHIIAMEHCRMKKKKKEE
jgi:hypothetical protein